ncbi:MFS transporter [Metasolibacillus meyeri]|uniref:MFS transporter n=1 Tax=Metasolibacillus meyeri TaxID=1071052 RepID=UPI000D3053D8|nr:MFS transporter [Metasolibacillus meyeri]
MNFLKQNTFYVFLWIIISQFVSLLGSSMTRFVLGIWIYQSTGQVLSFAMVMVASYLPSVVVSPFVGNYIDRKGPRLALAVGGILGTGVLAFGTVAAMADHLTVFVIFLLTITLSVVSALEMPALQALTPLLVSEERLSQANGMLASATSTTNIVGPILAGALYGFGQISWIIGINFVTYLLALIVILILWKSVDTKKENDNKKQQYSFWQDMLNGFHYTYNNRALFAMIMFHTWLNVALGVNSVIRQPYILDFGSEEQFGLVTSLFGVGMVLGSIAMSTLKVNSNMIRYILLSSLGMGLAVLLTGLTESIWLIGCIWIMMGFLLPITNTLSITLIQRNTDAAYLGRVFSISRMLSWGTLPLAYVIGGVMGDWLVSHRVTFMFLNPYGFLLVVAGASISIIVAYYASFSNMKKLEETKENITS